MMLTVQIRTKEEPSGSRWPKPTAASGASDGSEVKQPKRKTAAQRWGATIPAGGGKNTTSAAAAPLRQGN